MYYGPTILQKAGFGNPDNPNSTLIDALPLALMNFLGTIVVVIYIDKLGRRYIMLRIIPFISLSLLLLSAGLGMHNWGTGNLSDIG